jgi:hypothetical protein
MSILRRDHVSVATSNNTIKWDDAAGSLAFSKRVGNTFADAPAKEPVAVDIWTTLVGWEWWAEIGTTKSRQTALVPASTTIPARPGDKAREIYSIPLYSREIGGRRDFIVKGKNQTEALCDLFDSIDEIAKTAEAAGDLVVPVIKVGTRETDDFGTAPVFEVLEWVARPNGWPRPVVSFT